MAAASEMRAALHIVGLLILAGCSSDESTSLESLKRPVLLWSHQWTLCSANRAIDSERQVWDDEGCETDVNFHSVGRAAQAKTDALAAMMDAVLVDPVDQRPCRDGDTHIFSLIDTNSTSIFVCGVGAGADADPPAPYDVLATSFRDVLVPEIQD